MRAIAENFRFCLLTLLITGAQPKLAVADKPQHGLLTRTDGTTSLPITSAVDWKKRREEILQGMQEAMGPLPSRANLPSLDPRWEEEFAGPTFTRHKVTFVSEGTSRVSCYLFIPKGVREGTAPGVIALHQTVLEGKGEPAGLTPNKNQRYGLELAERGYVVLAPDYPSFGEYAHDFDADDYQFGTMKGIFDHLRAVDLLTSLKEVDPTRIGAIGHSLGGHNAIFLGAFDERVKVVVSCCGWTSFAKYYGGDLTGWTSARYMPRIRTAYNLDPARMPFDFDGAIAAIAPRAFLSISPLHDDNFAVEGVRQTIAEVEQVYALVGAPENLHVEYPDCKHDFPPEMRAKAYDFLERALRPAAASPSSLAPAK